MPSNIIFITIDSLRPDHTSLYGYHRDTTPFLSQMSKEAIVFRNAYSNSSSTVPSFASCFTSYYPFMCLNYNVLSYVSTLPEILSHYYGYFTIAINTNPLLKYRLRIDKRFQIRINLVPFKEKTLIYRTVRKMDNLLLEWIARKNDFKYFYKISKFYKKYIFRSKDVFELLYADVTMISDTLYRIIRSCKDSLKKKPFFIWIHYMNTHIPYIPFFNPDCFVSYYDKNLDIYDALIISEYFRLKYINGMNIDSTEEKYWMKKLIALYDSAIKFVDLNIADLVSIIDDLGLLDETFLVIFSDHGDEHLEHQGFGHGHTLYNELVRVLLMIRPPNSSDLERKDVFARFQLKEITPLTLDIANEKYEIIHKRIHGEKNTLFLELPKYDNKTKKAIRRREKKAIISDRYKLILTYNPFPKVSKIELYDLDKDPNEKKDISIINVDIVKELMKRIEEHNKWERKMSMKIKLKSLMRRKLMKIT